MRFSGMTNRGEPKKRAQLSAAEFRIGESNQHPASFSLIEHPGASTHWRIRMTSEACQAQTPGAHPEASFRSEE
jgi:hypothetical protein